MASGGEDQARPMTFLEAAAFQWVNPKAWVMAITAMAVYSNTQRPFLSVVLIAVSFAVVNLPSVSCWAGFGTALRGFLSDPVRLPENVPLEVMISLGSFYPQDPNNSAVIRKELRERALVQVQGRTLVMARGTFARAASAPETGTNHVGGSFASGAFSGSITDLHRIGEDIAFAAATFPGSLVAEEEITHDAATYPGPLVLQLTMPPNASGRNEPLLVTGKNRAGDILFIRYLDESHVQIGFDHWLKGGPISEVFPCDFSVPHAITLSMGSLLPPVSSERPDPPAIAALRTRCVVLFDGKPAIDWTTPFYPAALDQIFVGVDPIGGSSSDAKFNGTILKITRARPEHLLLTP